MESRHYYRSLARTMVLIVILVSFAPLVMVTAIIGYRFETSYRYQVVAHLLEMVEKHRQNIDIFLNDKLSSVQVLANSFTPDQMTDKEFLSRQLAVLQSSYSGAFIDIGLVDDRGIQIAYAGPFKLAPVDYSRDDWFKIARERPFFISDVFHGFSSRPHFIITANRKWDDREYILRATMDFEEFNSIVEGIRIGHSGSAYIIDNRGQLQTRPLNSSHPDRDFFSGLLSRSHEGLQFNGALGQLLTVMSSPSNCCDGNKDVSIGRVYYKDRDVIYIMVPVKNSEWVLVYMQEETDAFADLYRARKPAVLIALLGGISIVVMAFALSRRMVRRIEKANREKEQMNQRVIEAGRLASVGELAAGVAHEINNPVAIIVEEAGWMDDLLDEEDLGQSQNLDEFKASLNQIKTQAQRCKEINQKLLSFARGTESTVSKVKLNDLINEIVGILEQRSRLGNVKIVKRLSTDLPDILASPTEVQQVVLNLINNAIDAIGQDWGAIEITTGVIGDTAIVDVTDTGPGIPEEVLPRVFNPFFTTKPVGKGTGLGLSICYGIVKKMGGEITINSTIGVGTTFHIRLPINRGACESGT